ncbi:MAG TPA: HD domain-containing protein [Armatimonadota bacterium]|jgi:3'-5' exoribonuclease
MADKVMAVDLVAGEGVETTFAVGEFKLLPFKNKPGHFLDLRLLDRSGEVTGRVWDDAEELAAGLAVGQIVWVRGRVEEYKGARQLVVNDLQPAAPEEYDFADFVRCASRPVEEMLAELDELIASVETPPLRELLELVFADEEFRAQFSVAPGAARLHHACRGGLLEHSLSVAALCEQAARRHPELHRDLLLTGALLHDIGKVQELQGELAYEYSEAGRFCGHIVLGDRLVMEKVAQCEGFPLQLRQLLTHLLLSHHGELQYGAPVRPKIAEALALHYADNLDAKLQIFEDYRHSAESGTGDWSPYHHSLEAQVYMGKVAPEGAAAEKGEPE